MSNFQDNSDQANASRAAHRASGRPRYSVATFADEGRSEHWTDDRDAALSVHQMAAARPDVGQVLTFDHLELEMVAMHFLSDGKSYEEIAADADKLIDARFDRWLADG